MTKLFFEKYRPRKLDDFIGNKEIVDIIKTFIKEKHIPHLIFCGPPSVGKTSLVHILASALFSSDMLKERILELNSSEDRGIRVIRNRVKKYVSSSIDLTPDAVMVPLLLL
jgi:replication factor C subunit 2/4